MNGIYPVENGLGCFTDFETYKIYNQEFNDYINLSSYLHNNYSMFP